MADFLAPRRSTGRGGGGQDPRILRQRAAALSDSLDRRLPPAAGGNSRLAVQIYNGGSMPTSAEKYYLGHPVTFTAPSCEGCVDKGTVDTDTSVAVLVLQGVPQVGEILLAYGVGGRWVAERGGPSCGNQPCCSSGCYITSSSLLLTYVDTGRNFTATFPMAVSKTASSCVYQSGCVNVGNGYVAVTLTAALAGCNWVKVQSSALSSCNDAVPIVKIFDAPSGCNGGSGGFSIGSCVPLSIVIPLGGGVTCTISDPNSGGTKPCCSTCCEATCKTCTILQTDLQLISKALGNYTLKSVNSSQWRSDVFTINTAPIQGGNPNQGSGPCLCPSKGVPCYFQLTAGAGNACGLSLFVYYDGVAAPVECGNYASTCGNGIAECPTPPTGLCTVGAGYAGAGYTMQSSVCTPLSLVFQGAGFALNTATGTVGDIATVTAPKAVTPPGLMCQNFTIVACTGYKYSNVTVTVYDKQGGSVVASGPATSAGQLWLSWAGTSGAFYVTVTGMDARYAAFAKSLQLACGGSTNLAVQAAAGYICAPGCPVPVSKSLTVSNTCAGLVPPAPGPMVWDDTCKCWASTTPGGGSIASNLTLPIGASCAINPSELDCPPTFMLTYQFNPQTCQSGGAGCTVVATESAGGTL